MEAIHHEAAELIFAARGLGGEPLPEAHADALFVLAKDPTPETWMVCHGIIVADGGMTLWDALLAVDPGVTPRCNPGLPDDPDEWDWAPTSEAIVRALGYANARTPVEGRG